MINRKAFITVFSIILLLFPVSVFAVEEPVDTNEPVQNENLSKGKDKDKDKENNEEHHGNHSGDNNENNEENPENPQGDNNEEPNNEVVEEHAQDGLPLIVIRVDEDENRIQAANDAQDGHTYGNIDAMNGDPKHEVRALGTIEFLLPDGYVSEYNSSSVPEGQAELSYIRGRGNVTWTLDKKAYKFKLNTKQDLLGMGSNKEWGLLANHLDITLSNNAIVMGIAQEFGMEFTMKMVPVEVVMIGSKSGRQSLGSYYLTELVDIGSSRVNIKELDEDDTSATANITGGYIVSLYYEPQNNNEPESNVFQLDSGLKFINKNPEFETNNLTPGQSEQRNYIRNYMQQIDDLIVKSEIIDEAKHNQINNLMDLQSTADYFLIQEFFVNFDAYKTDSNYLYKKRDGKLYWGPLWDFDLMYYMSTSDTSLEGFDHYIPNAWIDALREKDPLFVELLKERWAVLEPILDSATQSGGLMDQYKERQRAGWNTNNEIWHVGDDYGYSSIDEPYEDLRHKMDYRRNWINNNIDKIGEGKYKVSLEVDGEVVDTITLRANSILDTIELKPEKEGLLFKEWVVKGTDESAYLMNVTSDVTLVPTYVDPSDLEEIAFYFTYDEVWVSLEDGEYQSNELKVFSDEYYDIVKANLKWSSSNKNVATVKNGIVTLRSKGKAKITATFYDGTKKSYTINVFGHGQEFIDEPEDVVPEETSYTVEVGKTIQIHFHTLPDTLPVNPDTYIDVDREVGNEEVIEVDYSGNLVVKGLKEGETTITVKWYRGLSETYTEEKVITIKVVSKKDHNKEKEEHQHSKSEKESNKTSKTSTHSSEKKSSSEKEETKEKTHTSETRSGSRTRSHSSDSEEPEDDDDQGEEIVEDKNYLTIIVLIAGIVIVIAGILFAANKKEYD